jgi:DNA-binding response OmpR family regulator
MPEHGGAGFELDGFSVIEAETAAAGVRAATLEAPDLIVLDLGLPDPDGSDVIERLRVVRCSGHRHSRARRRQADHLTGKEYLASSSPNWRRLSVGPAGGCHA